MALYELTLNSENNELVLELTSLPEAPIDGKSYARKDRVWSEVEGAAQVQTDWTQEDIEAVDFLKNKPFIPAATDELINNSGFITSAAIPTTATGQTFTGEVDLSILLGAYYLEKTSETQLELTVASGAVIGGYASGIIISPFEPNLTGIVKDPNSGDYNTGVGIKNRFTIGKFQDAVYISYTEVL